MEVMSRSQVFTKIFHFSKNSRHHTLKANLSWLTKNWYVTGSESPVSIPFSVSLKLQFADDLESLHWS